MNISLELHNKTIDRIITDEADTLGVDLPVGRLMRDRLEILLRMVAGYGSTQAHKAEQLAVEVEELKDKVERLEAI